MLELNQCYNMDCMKGMAQFPDGFFDLAVVDPPYFSGPERRGYYGSKVSKIGVYRDYPVSPVWEIPGRAYFDELRRVAKHYIVWGCNYFSYEFAPGRIVWDKCKKGTSFSDCELAATDIFNTVRLFRFMWNGMLQGKSIAEGHIMQGKCGKPSKFKERYKKYKFMVEAPFSTSQLCCDVMKKGPAKKYERLAKRHERSIARMWFLPMRTRSGKWTTRRWHLSSCARVMTAINAKIAVM